MTTCVPGEWMNTAYYLPNVDMYVVTVFLTWAGILTVQLQKVNSDSDNRMYSMSSKISTNAMTTFSVTVLGPDYYSPRDSLDVRWNASTDTWTLIGRTTSVYDGVSHVFPDTELYRMIKYPPATAPAPAPAPVTVPMSFKFETGIEPNGFNAYITESNFRFAGLVGASGTKYYVTMVNTLDAIDPYSCTIWPLPESLTGFTYDKSVYTTPSSSVTIDQIWLKGPGASKPPVGAGSEAYKPAIGVGPLPATGSIKSQKGITILACPDGFMFSKFSMQSFPYTFNTNYMTAYKYTPPTNITFPPAPSNKPSPASSRAPGPASGPPPASTKTGGIKLSTWLLCIGVVAAIVIASILLRRKSIPTQTELFLQPELMPQFQGGLLNSPNVQMPLPLQPR
jgi:hypothetical protein